MADVTVTAASVVPGDYAVIEMAYKYGDTTAATAGQPVYLDDTTMTWKRADANDTLAISGGVSGRVGFILNGTANGQPANVLVEGDLVTNAVLTAGEVYVLSSTVGRFAPVADLTAGMYAVVLGIGLTTTRMRVKPIVSGTLR